jgi:MFS family permease
MIHWWGRLVYSLASVAAAAVLSVGLLMLAGLSPTLQGRGGLLGMLSAGAVSALIGLVFTFSLPGWLLGLPFVLAVKDLRAWRFWLWFAIGTCIGPLLMVGLVLFQALHDPHLHFSSSLSEAMFFVCLATGVSSLTTLIYLLLLRWAQKQEMKRSVVVEGGAENRDS